MLQARIVVAVAVFDGTGTFELVNQPREHVRATRKPASTPPTLKPTSCPALRRLPLVQSIVFMETRDIAELCGV